MKKNFAIYSLSLIICNSAPIHSTRPEGLYKTLAADIVQGVKNPVMHNNVIRVAKGIAIGGLSALATNYASKELESGAQQAIEFGSLLLTGIVTHMLSTKNDRPLLALYYGAGLGYALTLRIDPATHHRDARLFAFSIVAGMGLWTHSVKKAWSTDAEYIPAQELFGDVFIGIHKPTLTLIPFLVLVQKPL